MKKTPYLDFIKTLLPAEEMPAFEASYQARIAKSIKPITTKLPRSDFFSFAQKKGRKLTAPAFSHEGKVYDDVLYATRDEKSSWGSHFLHQGGFFYVQEVAAGLSAQVLDPQKGDLVLDLCAAPGGKTVQLADRLQELGGGFVLANEPLDARRKALIFNLNRCGLHNTAICGYRGEQVGSLVSETFDKVLVDAPCSGEGMNYKHDKHTRYRDAKLADGFAKLQLEILKSGLSALKVGGELVYSTCTLNPLENEGVVSQVLELFPDAVELMPVEIDQKSAGLTSFEGKSLLSEEQASQVARFWQHRQQTGGFFIAKMRKLKSIPVQTTLDQRKKSKSGLTASSELQDQVWKLLFEQWGIERRDGVRFLASESAVYLTSEEYAQLPSALFLEKVGVPIFKIGFKGERIPQQGLATCLGDLARKNIVSLSNEQAQSLSEKCDLQGRRADEGAFLICQREGRGFGLGKQVGERVKSKM